MSPQFSCGSGMDQRFRSNTNRIHASLGLHALACTTIFPSRSLSGVKRRELKTKTDECIYWGSKEEMTRKTVNHTYLYIPTDDPMGTLRPVVDPRCDPRQRFPNLGFMPRKQQMIMHCILGFVISDLSLALALAHIPRHLPPQRPNGIQRRFHSPRAHQRSWEPIEPRVDAWV